MSKPTLVIAVRGWTTSGEFLLFGRPGGELKKDFVAALSAEIPGAEVWVPDVDFGMFSMRTPESLASELMAKISEKVTASQRVESIVLLGYSIGSVLARRVFCMAHGAEMDGTITRERAAPWADKVDRLVMLAGITRGWEFSSASPAHVRFLGPILQRLSKLIGVIKRQTRNVESHAPLIWQLKRGSPFVVSTRIQYVRVFESLRSGPRPAGASSLRVDGLPSTVFLLGAKDEYVSPADCTELGPRIEFAFGELHGSNHSDAIQIVGDDPVVIMRRQRVVAAIVEDFGSLTRQPWAVPPDDIDDYLDPMDVAQSGSAAAVAGGEVEHAVMIVHGIRDNGFWTKRVAREVKTMARGDRLRVRAPTPSYGYFSMWDFVKPGGREQATFWFMEQYADVRCHFPNAKISFVGHSNGTYIAARALELCPAISFHNVVFAGSVVRRGFRWARFPGRIHAVLNYVGAGDGVVAFLPAVFELLRLSDLDVGGAGAFGFVEAEPPPAINKSLIDPSSCCDIKLTEIRFVKGGHAAAITETFWREIARFVLSDEVPSRVPDTRAEPTRLLFGCAPLVTTLGIVIAATLLTLPLSVAVILASLIATDQTPALAAAWESLIAIGISLFVSWVAGRFLRMW